jgi:ketosteroid isomerase-like protein
MSDSPIDQFLDAVDRFDVDAVMALLAPDGRLLTADGRRAQGADAVRELLSSFLAQLRWATHRVTAEWHEDDVWIAEVEAVYEVRDGMQTAPLPRAFVLRKGPDGLSDVHVYGAHELPLADYGPAHDGMRLGGRWIPAL